MNLKMRIVLLEQVHENEEIFTLILHLVLKIMNLRLIHAAVTMLLLFLGCRICFNTCV